jgi:hypothetical protein
MHLHTKVFVGTVLSGALIAGVSSPCAQSVSVTVDASTVTHVISDRLYGANGDIADNTLENGTNTGFNSLVTSAGIRYFRWPGGSTGDNVSWDSTTGISYAQGLAFMNAIGGTLQPIVNFSGYWNGKQHTEQQAEAKAAAWVRDYNVTRHLGAQYWEIGNEDYGPWEKGQAAGADYGYRFCAFYDSMKRVDSTIKIGAIVTPPIPFDTLFANFTVHELDTINKLHHVPDFLIVHIYPYIQMDQYATMFGLNMLPAGPNHLKDTLTTGAWVDTISSSVDTLNKWVTNYFGASNVGKIQYFYTEYSTGSYKTQNQTQTISAWFIAQTLMEFARLGITGSNPWKASYYEVASNPSWYVHPMFIYHYGRQVVNATVGSPNSRMRAWASRDSLGNLTMFLVNNAVDSTTDTAHVTISGVSSVGTTGQRWTMLTSGAAGSWQPNRTAISINGVVSPAAATVKTLPGQSIPTGATFSVALPPYSMTWLQIPVTTATLPSGRAAMQLSGVTITQSSGHALTAAFATANSAHPWSIAVFGVDGRLLVAKRTTGNRLTLDLGKSAGRVVICRATVDGREYGKTVVMR